MYNPASSEGPHAWRPGTLKNGNRSGDLSLVRRCGGGTRAGRSCRGPAMANGRCRMHGGKSTGPRTVEGRKRCRAAPLIHGRRSAAVVDERRRAAAIVREIMQRTVTLGKQADECIRAAGKARFNRPPRRESVTSREEPAAKAAEPVVTSSSKSLACLTD
jgi:hypothetical protein